MWIQQQQKIYVMTSGMKGTVLEMKQRLILVLEAVLINSKFSYSFGLRFTSLIFLPLRIVLYNYVFEYLLSLLTNAWCYRSCTKSFLLSMTRGSPMWPPTCRPFMLLRPQSWQSLVR